MGLGVDTGPGMRARTEPEPGDGVDADSGVTVGVNSGIASLTTSIGGGTVGDGSDDATNFTGASA